MQKNTPYNLALFTLNCLHLSLFVYQLQLNQLMQKCLTNLLKHSAFQFVNKKLRRYQCRRSSQNRLISLPNKHNRKVALSHLQKFKPTHITHTKSTVSHLQHADASVICTNFYCNLFLRPFPEQESLDLFLSIVVCLLAYRSYCNFKVFQ